MLHETRGSIGRVVFACSCCDLRGTALIAPPAAAARLAALLTTIDHTAPPEGKPDA